VAFGRGGSKDRRLGLNGELFRTAYASVFDGDARWRSLDVPTGDRYRWADDSTYVARPRSSWACGPNRARGRDRGSSRARALGDSVTTDHISPAGSIAAWSPAGKWLQARGVAPLEFNSYGARRRHHEVMMRGTFANIRLHNALADREGPFTVHLPDGEATRSSTRRSANLAEGACRSS